LVNVEKLGVLLEKTSLRFECEGVLNPAVIRHNGRIHLFYRAVTTDNYSTIGYCRLSSPTVIEYRKEEPLLIPQAEYEFQGLEDPRIVQIEGLFYLSYTAFNGINALGALAVSTDLIHWEKKGIIVPQITYEEFKHFTNFKGSMSEKYIRFNEFQRIHTIPSRIDFLWDKNLVFFPRKINGKICFLHRIKPDIQVVVEVNELSDLSVEFWQDYFFHFDEYVVLSPKFDHEVSYVGCGSPPIETEFGWLLIYHGVHDTVGGYVYTACASLLDLDKPQLEKARLPYPLFFPEKDWEIKGEVNNVCFPTGCIVEGELLYIYYGAADERIAVASVNLDELLKELLANEIS
jgi:predicted GH43/DUF377 family glycosyl hydrolase